MLLTFDSVLRDLVTAFDLHLCLLFRPTDLMLRRLLLLRNLMPGSLLQLLELRC
jgi:hypothetical protein